MDIFWRGRIQIFTLKGTRSAAATGKSLATCRDGCRFASYARDLLRVERENSLVLYPIHDPWSNIQNISCFISFNVN